jgi:hypothetical protein
LESNGEKMGDSARRREEKREFFFLGSSPEGAMRGYPLI